jgi:hypothetical protein
MIKVYFTAKKLAVFDVLPRGSTFNQLYFINHIFPNLKAVNVNFRRQKAGSTFWVHRDNSMYQNGSKITSNTKRNHISRMSHSPYSPYINPCDFWLFGMFKQILRNQEFSSSDEIEDAIAQIWNRMTSLLTTSSACSGTGSGVLPGSLRMVESILTNKTRFGSSCRLHVEIGIGTGDFLDTL